MTTNSRSTRTLVMALLIVLIAQFGAYLAVAETQNLIDSTIVVPNFNYYTISREIDIEDLDNVSIEGTIEVSDGYINLYVMDSNGYSVFKKDRDPQGAIYRADNIQSHSIAVAVTKGGTYYIVLHNEDLFGSKTVRVKLTLSFERPSEKLMEYAVVAIVAVVAVVAIIFVFRRLRKGPNLRGMGSSATMSADAFVPKNCTYCGAVMHQMAKTCPSCGRGQRR